MPYRCVYLCVNQRGPRIGPLSVTADKQQVACKTGEGAGPYRLPPSWYPPQVAPLPPSPAQEGGGGLVEVLTSPCMGGGLRPRIGVLPSAAYTSAVMAMMRA